MNRPSTIDELKASFAQTTLPETAWADAAEYLVRHDIDPEHPLIVSYIDSLRVQARVQESVDAAVLRIETAAAAVLYARDEITPDRSRVIAEAEGAATTAIRSAIAEALANKNAGLVRMIVAEFKRQMNPVQRGVFIVGTGVGAITALVLQALVFLGGHHG